MDWPNYPVKECCTISHKKYSSHCVFRDHAQSSSIEVTLLTSLCLQVPPKILCERVIPYLNFGLRIEDGHVDNILYSTTKFGHGS